MTLEGHASYIVCEQVSLAMMPGKDYEQKDISYISCFPDGKQMLSGSGDTTIRRWDLREGKEIKETLGRFLSMV